MQPQHTPGPWMVDAYFDVQANGEDVARIASNYDHAAADAALIAAAPDLLEALKAVLPFVATDVVESCNGNKCREPWCAGCFGEDEAQASVDRAMLAYRAGHAAIKLAIAHNA